MKNNTTPRALAVLSIGALFLVQGCIIEETLICDPGYVEQDDRCPPVDASVMDATNDGTSDVFDSGSPDAFDGGPDAGPCGECSADAPLCNEGTMECVQCLAPSDCAGVANRPLCENNSCVQCANSTQCDTPEASLCGDEGLCEACAVNDDCAGVVDADANTLGVCDTSGGAGVCVGCTEATAEDDCGDFSCDPATNLCTETERGDVNRCGACVSDAECMAGHACIEIDELGGTAAYCMPILPKSEICPNIYRSVLMDVTTLSGAGPASYCTFDLAQFSCAGVLSLGSTFEALEPRCSGGAQCETIPGQGEVCTIACGTTPECPSVGPFSTCGGDYCGS